MNKNSVIRLIIISVIVLALVFFIYQSLFEDNNSQKNNPTTESTFQLTESEKKWLRAHPIIRISPDSYYEPIELVRDGIHSGMTGDYFELFSNMLGITFKLIQHEKWSETMIAMDSGDIDIFTALQNTSERRLKYNFTSPYISLNSVMITDRLNTNNKMYIEDLSGKKLAVVDGYFWGDLVRRDYPEINLVPVSDISEGLQKTALGTADAFLGSFAALSYYINKQEITNLMVAGNAPYEINYGVAVRKDWPELAAILDKAIQSISSETHKNIRNRWIKLEYEPPLLNRQVTSVLLVFAVIATLIGLVGIYISSILRRKVQSKTKELYFINRKLEHIVESRTQDLRKANEKLLSSESLLLSTNKTLEEEVNKDSLTNIPNRRRLEKVLEIAIQDALSTKTPISIIMIDIDHFKLLNDHYGHLIGDQCLIEVAKCLDDFTNRGGEFVARFGGEEFMMVIPRLDENGAKEYARLVLEKVHNLSIEHSHSPTEKIVTLSIGVATFDPLKTQLNSFELIDRSDQAMYQAKHNGRNQVVTYSQLSKPL